MVVPNPVTPPLKNRPKTSRTVLLHYSFESPRDIVPRTPRARNGGGPPRPVLYPFFQLNGCQTASLTVLHHERFRPSDLLASWERAPIGCCWKGWINRLATKVIFNRDEAHIAETSARGPSSATRGVDALTGLNRRREMGFVGTAPRGLLYLFGERYAWARPPCLFSAGPDPSRSF